MHAVGPDPVYPALHEHAAIDIAPEEDVVVCKGQDSQLELPTEALYEPLGHGEHGPASEPEYPALHLQSNSDIEPVITVVEKSGQFKHPTDPVEDLYCPTLQAMHWLPPLCPALQLHPVAA